VSDQPPSIRATEDPDLRRRNEEFWDELCGTAFARERGLTGRDQATLMAFDRAYFDYYPYLVDYVERFDLRGRSVLEIGLGYGSLGQAIAARGAEYHGLDVALGPVEMMRHRLDMLGGISSARVQQGSAIAIPHADASFDYVYSIGCLHHTGALPQSVTEVRRVLRPGGTAVVMLYHLNSARQLTRRRLAGVLARATGRKGPSLGDMARYYDTNSGGATAPHTEFVSRSQVRELFADFSELRIEARNFDDVHVRGRRLVSRTKILGTPLERLLGLDLYVTARR